MLYALIIFIPIRFMGELYRVSRLTGWEFNTVQTIGYIVIVIEFIIGTLLIIFLTRNLLRGRKANFWTVILWVPYFVLFVYIIASLFPITYEGDMLSPGAGFIMIGILMVYPLYVLIINFIGFTSDDKGINTV